MSLAMFIQHLLNGLTLGSLYALIAIGYTMVYGILRLINFAHGEIFMLGAYFVFWGVTLFHLPWFVAVIVSIIVTSFAGIMVDRVAYRPLREAPRISALISSIGVSFFLQNFAIVVFSAIPREVQRPDWLVNVIVLGKVRLLPLTLVVPALSFVLMLALLFVVYKTKPGLGMRAISKDIETSRLMGVPVNKVIALTFGMGSALAAASGIMWALRYPQLQPIMGVIPGFKAFIAAVFGGIGSIQGAVIGGLILGFIEIMIVAFMPSLAGYRDAFAFVLLIIILLFKPTGLLGEKLEDKV
ncbi:amino acid/amide ABC transporter membrane protein 1, HAAT family [Thermovirga lienii DSM 17291]|jgi:branched-chain amino acid transport system permease protein|uniref:Amino acid/amide ABC transporter membrane protein 1, HAAT family n=1 Tax=Thermovirga lienii (strain ATCC BAA-1197 / DSM 17291 / Cas60314) TaxID=580340 RepID=G7V678_THELD|nr:branched-chain amino acid ABC transporter permease [Thermovirga lienii]AER67065.1 amino acid/amide ABC transporter membrane protein 1, HAAT family [Thermovirga lienii DSM 17291]KUK42743.1 MAG: Amino acid/amide ABC transporter membrane protein 1, HAAT family [Thermovirga lienii]MDN5318382.1 branched-chain amino acid transport system permease protein [Thermovirga sp.]HCD71537.1 branched-chain amino acid ABC transporter permease [Thermovirga lienii]